MAASEHPESKRSLLSSLSFYFLMIVLALILLFPILVNVCLYLVMLFYSF